MARYSNATIGNIINANTILGAISVQNAAYSTSEKLRETKTARMIYEFASAENIGDRKEQQDRVVVRSHPTAADVVLAVLTDGMGGHSGGALAAQSVIDAVVPMFGAFTPEAGAADDWLRGMIMAAHDKVAAAGKGYNRDPRATCVLALAQPGRIDWAHCGDSRLYLFRDGEFVSRTEDHSLVEILLQQGKITEAEVHTHPERSKLFTSLGGPEPPQIATGTIEKCRPQDTVLLASDGLWAYFQPHEMADLTGYRNLTAGCDRLIGLARKRAGGNGDNVSVAMIRAPAPAKRGLIGALFGARVVEPSSFEDARRFMTKYLQTTMGRAANDLTARIETCETAVELAVQISLAAGAVERHCGAVEAAVFTQQAKGLMEDA